MLSLLVAVMLLSLLSGCGGGGEQAAQGQTKEADDKTFAWFKEINSAA